MKFIFSLFIGFSTGFSALAQTPPKPAVPARSAAPAPPASAPAPAKLEGQWATVKTDNALVYEQPDFDAATIMYLPAGRKIRVSKKIYGSYFKFYRVKATAQKFGYITTIDMIPDKAGATAQEAKGDKPVAAKAKKTKRAANAKPAQAKYPPVKSFVQTKYLGIYLGSLAYKEKIVGVNSSESLIVYGFKLTGPHTLISLPTDFNFLIHYGAPTYYEKFSTVKPSGFVMIVDWMAMFPFLDHQNNSFYLGLGPLLDYSSFQFGTSTGTTNSSDLSIGLSAELGFGIKFGTNWAGRAEYKLMWERANYTQIGVSLQNRF